MVSERARIGIVTKGASKWSTVAARLLADYLTANGHEIALRCFAGSEPNAWWTPPAPPSTATTMPWSRWIRGCTHVVWTDLPEPPAVRFASGLGIYTAQLCVGQPPAGYLRHFVEFNAVWHMTRQLATLLAGHVQPTQLLWMPVPPVGPPVRQTDLGGSVFVPCMSDRGSVAWTACVELLTALAAAGCAAPLTLAVLGSRPSPSVHRRLRELRRRLPGLRLYRPRSWYDLLATWSQQTLTALPYCDISGLAATLAGWCGSIVLGFDELPLTELVQHGENGVLVGRAGEADAANLATALQTLAADPSAIAALRQLTGRDLDRKLALCNRQCQQLSAVA